MYNIILQKQNYMTETAIQTTDLNAFLMEQEAYQRKIIVSRIIKNRLIWAPTDSVARRQVILRNWRNGKTAIPYFAQLIIGKIVLTETGKQVFNHSRELYKYFQIPA